MKFALMNLEEGFVPNALHESTGKEGIMEKWILSRLHHATQVADQGWKTYDLLRPPQLFIHSGCTSFATSIWYVLKTISPVLLLTFLSLGVNKTFDEKWHSRVSQGKPRHSVYLHRLRA